MNNDQVMEAIGEVFTVIGVFGAMVLALLQYRNALPRRTLLRTELEILNLLNVLDISEGRDEIFGSVTRGIQEIYLGHPVGRRVRLAAASAMYVGMAVGFAFWTFLISEAGFNWWSVGAGYVTLTIIMSPLLLHWFSRRLASLNQIENFRVPKEHI